jgi:hypothetical protein
MRDKLVGTALLAFGLVNAVPSLAAVNPVAVTVDYIDDDLTGSGMEQRENGVKQAQRRHAVRPAPALGRLSRGAVAHRR